MRVERYPDAATASRAVADEIAAAIAPGTPFVLGLAAGRTPLDLYADLVARHRAGALSFAAVQTFALDEYVGLAPGAPGTFRRALGEALLDHLDLQPGAARFPPTTPAADPATYDAAIADAGGVDLQLLGLGSNGHIAFNEPGSPATSRTRRVELAPATRQANGGTLPSDLAVPTHAVTMGVATILAARRIRVLAFGAGKAAIVARLLASPPTPDLPASLLASHPDVCLVVDEAALPR